MSPAGGGQPRLSWCCRCRRRDLSLGFPWCGTTTYYSENVTEARGPAGAPPPPHTHTHTPRDHQDEIKRVNDAMIAAKLSPYNTRLFKHADG